MYAVSTDGTLWPDGDACPWPYVLRAKNLVSNLNRTPPPTLEKITLANLPGTNTRNISPICSLNQDVLLEIFGHASLPMSIRG
ncbi:hypothetical protein SCHPADRAFT_926806, partial [Schizopora paradoxa]